MKKIFAWMLLPALLMSILAGCGNDREPPGNTEKDNPSPTVTRPEPTDDAETSVTRPEPTDAAENSIGDEDSYWVVYEYFDEEYGQMRTTESVGWHMDLFIMADGTARFRDIHNQLCVMDDDGLHLQWMLDENGKLEMYNAAYDDPLLEGALEGDLLSLSYRGMDISLKQAPMPQSVGELYSPAELTGTWVAISTETEGDVCDLFPASFEALAFYIDAEQMTLVADMACRGYLGSPMEDVLELPLEILDEALYPACENEQWSVRIGPNGEGKPADREICVTLVERNVLLLQNYYTLDGAPAVSYVTYRRAMPETSWWEVSAGELAETNWYCASYLNAEGKQLEIPERFQDLCLQLGTGDVCFLGEERGTWQVSRGGSVALYFSAEDDAIYGYSGAVRVSCAGGDMPFYEMYLFYEGGLLRFLIDSYG